MFLLNDKLARQRKNKYKNLILSDNPSFYAPLSDKSGTNILDITSNANNGTLAGGTLSHIGTPIVGENSSAVYFNGAASQKIDVPDVASVTPPGSFTIECWVNRLDTNPAEFMCKGTTEFAGAGAGTDFEMGHVGTSTYFQFRDSGGASNSHLRNSPAINTWNYYVARFTSGSLMELFINDVKTSKSISGTAIETSTGGMKISGTTYRLNGYICHTAMYQYALTDGQILNHYYTGVGAK